MVGILPNDLPNDAPAVRLIGALMLEARDERAVTRRSMSLKALARVAHADPVSPPTTAARPARVPPKAGAPTPPGGALPRSGPMRRSPKRRARRRGLSEPTQGQRMKAFAVPHRTDGGSVSRGYPTAPENKARQGAAQGSKRWAHGPLRRF